MKCLLVLAPLTWPAASGAQVIEVVVGVTPTCPYGIMACWPSAREGLKALSGVDSVAETPDSFNCTGAVILKHEGLPVLDVWPRQFAEVVGEVFILRGVEVTVKGTIEGEGEALRVRVPGVKEALFLGQLRDKLQWNFRKRAARQPEPDEANAWKQLVAVKKKADVLEVTLTGPLRKTDKGAFALQVREFFPEKTASPRRKD
jgi:hypothetical protein